MKNQSLFVRKMTALAMALLILFASTATRVDAAPNPDLTPQQIEAVIEDAFAGLVTFDVPRVMNHFAADAVVEDPVGTPAMQGTQAITAYLESFPTLFNQMKLYSLVIKTGGQEAAVTWRYVSRPRADMCSSLKASDTSSSTRMEKFKRKKSSSISRIFWSNCRSKRLP